MSHLLQDWFFLALASAFVFGLAGIFMKASQATSASTPHLLVGLYTSGAALFILHTSILGHWDGISWGWILGGIIVGSGSAWGNDVFMRALQYGPASLTSPLSNMNVIFVVLAGSIWFKEPLSAWQLAAIVCLIIAVFLLTYKPSSALSTEKLPLKWFGLIFACMVLFALRNGGLKVTQELSFQNDAILAIAYIWSLMWFAIPLFRASKQTNEATKSSLAKKGWLWGLAAGVCSYGGLQLYAYALQNGQANIIAPIFATNSLFIAIGSMWFFRERLEKWQWIALGFLMCGMVWIRWN